MAPRPPVGRSSFLVVALVLAGCASAPAATTTTTQPAPTPPTTAGLTIPTELERFPVGYLEINGTSVPVAIAASRPLRVQGLAGIADLGDLAGMLFVFDPPSSVSFTMRDVVIPLDLHHLDASGTILEIIPMEPCEGPECSFPASVTFSYSLETPPGAFDLSVGDQIGLPGP
ncbi:MAG: DUF192 domain-containing protein [Acidimicrobiia bacterium]|nr:DUF192 domain-containing protein [Acidimicrobiia bacterium]